MASEELNQWRRKSESNGSSSGERASCEERIHGRAVNIAVASFHRVKSRTTRAHLPTSAALINSESSSRAVTRLNGYRLYDRAKVLAMRKKIVGRAA